MLNKKIPNKRQNYENYKILTKQSKVKWPFWLKRKNDETQLEIAVSYIVYNASWSPKYDVRVFDKDNSMVINYFGVITQSTGEDWLDTKLSLSTAVPSVGGNVPELGTQNVQIKKPVVMYCLLFLLFL